MGLCILVVNVMSGRYKLLYYSEIRDEREFTPVCMLPLAGRMRTLCIARLQCLPDER